MALVPKRDSIPDLPFVANLRDVIKLITLINLTQKPIIHNA